MLKGIRIRSILVAMTLVAGVLLSACSQGSPGIQSSAGGQSQKQETAKTAEPVKVGVIGAYSGASADMGVAMRNGVELAVEEFNNAGGVSGRKVELVNFDDEGNPSKATTGIQKLIESDKVSAVIGNPNTATAIAVVKVTTREKVPQIVPIAQSPEVLEPFSEWAFRTTATNPMDIEKLVAFLQQKKWTKVGILHDTSAYGLSGLKLLEAAVPKAGLQIVAKEGHPVGAPDLTPQALNFKKAGAEAIVMWNLGADGGRFAKNTRAIGWKVPLLGGRGHMFAIFTSVAGQDGQGTVATGAFDLDKVEAKDFLKKYEAKFKATGSIDFAALGYDAAKVLLEAIKKVGPEKAGDRKAVRDAIETTKDFKTVTGVPGATVTFDAKRHEGADGANSVVLVEHNGQGWGKLSK